MLHAEHTETCVQNTREHTNASKIKALSLDIHRADSSFIRYIHHHVYTINDRDSEQLLTTAAFCDAHGN